MGEPPGDPNEVQAIGARLLDREDEEPPYAISRGPPADGWTYEGVTSYAGGHDPLQIEWVNAIQKREASGGGDYLHRRVTLREEQRVGPADGGSPDHRELDTDRMFDAVGIVTNHRDGPLTETAGVVMAEIGFGVDDPLWYWTPIEHEAESPNPAPTTNEECTCGENEACDVCGGQP